MDLLNLRNKDYGIFILVIWIILLPLLFFPLSGDLALFLSAVKVLDGGGLVYKDIIDIKPPFLFYAIKGITVLFGSGEQSVRIFDFLMQTLISSMMYFLVLKITRNKVAAFASGVMYALTYVICNSNNTTQIESFFGLCTIPMIYLQIYKRDKAFLFFLISFVIGLFTGMKYTLGLLLAAPLIDDIFFVKSEYFDGAKWKQILRKFIFMSMGFVLAFGITLIPYLNAEVFQGWREMSSYFSFYATHTKFNADFISSMLNSINELYSSFITFPVVAFILSAIIYYIKNYKAEREESSFFRATFIVLILVFITFLVERKGMLYQHTRMNAAYMMFAGVGFSMFITFAKEHYKERFQKFVIIVLIGLILTFSPLIRWINLSSLPYKYIFDKASYAAMYERSDRINVTYINHRQVAEYVNQRINKDDKVILAATGSGYINYLLNTKNLSKFTQSSYYVYLGASEKHQRDFIEEIKSAKYTIIQTNDIYGDVNGRDVSTYHCLIANPLIKAAMDSYLIQDTCIGNYIIMHNAQCIIHN